MGYATIDRRLLRVKLLIAIGGDSAIRSLLRAFELLQRMQAQGLRWDVPIASRQEVIAVAMLRRHQTQRRSRGFAVLSQRYFNATI